MSPRFLTSLELFLKGANLASRPASSAPSPSFPGLTKAAAMSFFVQLKQTDWRSRQEGLQWSSLLTSSQDTPQWPGPAGFKGTQELQTHFLQHKRRQQSAHSGHKGEEFCAQAPEGPASHRLCYWPLKQRHPWTGGKGCRNRKSLTETLLIKEIPPPPNLSMEGWDCDVM